jgi:cysteine-rich repeat protein
MRTFWIILALLSSLPACVNSQLVHCGELLCDQGSICVASGCATATEAAACIGIDEAKECKIDGVLQQGSCTGRACRAISCSDRIVSYQEVCDDGNKDAGDGCSPDCRSNEECGNGTVDRYKGSLKRAEKCDDGNNINDDDCSNDCQFGCGDGAIERERGERCDNGEQNSNSPNAECRIDCQLRRCGDGIVDDGEKCDDGNHLAGDGCSADCKSREVCGDGHVDSGAQNPEACDDGNQNNDDQCSDLCRITNCGDGNINGPASIPPGSELCDEGAANSNTPGAHCRLDCQPSGCGDGVVDGIEKCDDGNNVSGDGCAADCSSNESCGNAIVDLAAGEQCDDGNRDDHDNCRNTCVRPGRCGDGILQPAELCDDGNNDAGDGCSADCLSKEVCGNELVDGAVGEQCDKGAGISGDGCSSKCSVEFSNWKDVSPLQISARQGHTLMYDVARHRVVLFGGSDSGNASSQQTWEYDGRQWARISLPSSPAGRSGHAMSYDSVRRRGIMFGGVASDGSKFNDTWEYDGNSWQQIVTRDAPTARSGHVMFFDTSLVPRVSDSDELIRHDDALRIG